MNRCLSDYPDSKAFFTKTVNGEERCACAEDYCAERSDLHHTFLTQYKFVKPIPDLDFLWKNIQIFINCPHLK